LGYKQRLLYWHRTLTCTAYSSLGAQKLSDNFERGPSPVPVGVTQTNNFDGI